MSKELKVPEQFQTMSSLEIAELTGKRHDNILRDIREQLEQAEIDVIKFEGIYLDAYKREKPCYKLPYRETMLIISGYSVEIRLKIIDRWMELEKQAKGWSDSRSLTRECYKRMCDELNVYRNKIGKETKAFHYSNEARMINQIVLGVNKVSRDDQPKEILDRIDNLSVTNISLIRAGFGYDERKEVLKRADTPNVLTFKSV